jgi:AraC family transcriptional regulator
MNTTTCDDREIFVPISTFGSLVSLLREAAQSIAVAPERASEFVAKAAVLLSANGAAGQTPVDRLLLKTELPTLSPWRIRRIVAYVEQNLAAELDVPKMACLVGLSTHHFSRLFKNSMGIPPCQYVLRKRVNRATQLMVDSGKPLTDIALACGFANQSHFSRVFKRILRLSPGVWRRYHADPTAASEAVTSTNLPVAHRPTPVQSQPRRFGLGLHGSS